MSREYSRITVPSCVLSLDSTGTAMIESFGSRSSSTSGPSLGLRDDLCQFGGHRPDARQRLRRRKPLGVARNVDRALRVHDDDGRLAQALLERAIERRGDDLVRLPHVVVQ